jgi:membrane protein DedA with SNARE-associated domain
MFSSAMLQNLFPPYPGDVIIAFSGYISSHLVILGSFRLSFILNTLIIFLGTIFSSYLIFSLGYAKGESILRNKYINKYFPINNYDNIKKFVDKYGIYSIIISKFIPGIYTLVILAAGIFKFDKFKTIISICIVTIIHNGLLIFIGKKVGNNINLIKNIMSHYNKYLIILILLLIFIIILYNALKRKK